MIWQESPWGTGLQGKEHHGEFGMPWEGILMGREQPCCWQSCPLLLLSTGLVHSSTGSSTLAYARESDSASATYLQTSSVRAVGVRVCTVEIQVCAMAAMKLIVTRVFHPTRAKL